MTEVLYREQVGLLAYSPLAFGHLTGKYVENLNAKGRVNLFPGYAQRYKNLVLTRLVLHMPNLPRNII